jgi:uncharacterized protein YfaS (alpha-2-macroglobulin family)
MLGSCSSKKQLSEEQDFLPYISGFTSGQISKYSTIRIVLANEVSDAEPGTPLTANVLEFSPKIKGETYWVDNRTLEFKPEEPLKNNQEYIATFHLSKFEKVEKKLETFIFQFYTIKQAVNVETALPVVTDNGIVEFSGRLYLADRDDLEKVRQIVTVTLNSRELPVEWKTFVPTEGGYVYEFSVSGIKQMNQEQLVAVKWNGSPVQADSKGEKIVSVPSDEGFKLMGHTMSNGDDAHIQLNFNAPLKRDQDYKSLCYFRDGDITATYVQEGSLLKIYPSKLFFEEKELVLDPNLKSQAGNDLGTEISLFIRFENLKPAVRFINKGVILPNSSEGLVLPFQAVNLRAVDVYVLKIYENNVLQFLQVNDFSGEQEIKKVARPLLKKTLNLAENRLVDLSKWQTFSIDLGKLIKQEPGAIYRIFIRFKKDYSTYPCSEEFEDPINSEADLDKMWDQSIYTGDYYDFYYRGYSSYNSELYSGDYWSNRDNPCHPFYYYREGRGIQTNIFASDFGIIAKAGENNNFFVVVTNLLSTAPEKDATVLFYNYQQQIIAQAKTDSKGFVEIPLDKKPYFIEVKKDKQRGYLKVEDSYSLSLSNFDVSGEQYAKGVKGFIYGERGVWRPGDTLHISFIIQDKDKVLPEGHPITMEIKNPREQLYTTMMQRYSPATDFYVFRIPTTSDVITGTWNIKIQVGGSVFSKSVPIETVKPNRLKITLDVNTDIIKSGSTPRFTLQSAWLQGATASDKKTDVKVKYRTARTAFDEYKEYVFISPLAREFSSEEKLLFEGRTDADGNAVFTKEMPAVSNAPGMLQADFTTRVFEGEGDFSINYKSIKYSPFAAYLGMRIPKAQNPQGILYTNREQTFDLVLVNENGKLTNSNKITFTVYKLDWRWWWDTVNEDNLAYYVNNEYARKYLTEEMKTQNGKASVTFEIPNRDWGRYFIVAKDEHGGHLTGAIVYFDWVDWLGRSGKDNPNGATMLTFSTDKDNYKVGEKIKIELPSSAAGRALITVENRSRVINARWVETKENNSSVEIEVIPEMVPNAYVYITMIQPHNNTVNDLPIRLYGVKNVMVTDKETRLNPVIKMADKVEPEKRFTVEISESNKKTMTYTLAIVDEGLLDLTNFKTPDPHAEFYKREALGVRSWDMFDYVIGAYGGKIEQLFAIGGDMELGNADEDKTNSRFKPVVKFIGPCELKAGKSNKHEVTLPSYFGSVRVMVVAGNGYAYGNTEKAVKVQKPLMILATLPRVAGINEEIALPVNVFAMDETSGNVTVTVTGGNVLKIEGENMQKLSFDKPGDKIVTFRLKAAAVTGKEKIKVKATNGKTTAEYEVEMEVRNPNPRITESKSFIVRPGEKIDWPYVLSGMAGTNVLTMEASRIPSLNLESRLEYLIGYPHGCAEQTVSKGFPQLYLSSLMSLSQKEAAEMEENVKSTIQKITRMQRSDGAVLYWMGGNYTYDWVTTYAGHFMLEARNMGYAVPASFLSQWAGYQKQKAQSWSSYRNRNDYSSYDVDDLDQAYRLYTLALYGKPEVGAMNRLRETKNLSTAAAWRLAATYVLAGSPDVARKIIAGLSTEVKDYSAFNNTFGSSLRDMAMILETLVFLKDETEALKQAQLISARLNEDSWYSTQSTAYALIGMSKFAGLTRADRNINITYTQDGETFAKETKDPVYKVALNARRRNEGTIAVDNKGEGTVFVTFTQSGIPVESKAPAASSGLFMTVKYTDPAGNPVEIGSLRQGTDFVAHVTVKNISSFERYNEMSLIQVFPSGWEILNDRMMNGSSTDSDISYQDIRDDRVLTYFSLEPLEEKSFTVRLNAAYAGKFLLPATLCEAMYDNKVFARNQGQWVTVSK